MYDTLYSNQNRLRIMVPSARHMRQPRFSCLIFVTHEPQKRWCPQETNACCVSRSSIRQTSHNSEGPTDDDVWSMSLFTLESSSWFSFSSSGSAVRTAVVWIDSVRSNVVVDGAHKLA